MIEDLVISRCDKMSTMEYENLLLRIEIHLDERHLIIQAMFNPPFKKKIHDPSCHFIDLSYCNLKNITVSIQPWWSYHSFTPKMYLECPPTSKVKGFHCCGWDFRLIIRGQHTIKYEIM